MISGVNSNPISYVLGGLNSGQIFVPPASATGIVPGSVGNTGKLNEPESANKVGRKPGVEPCQTCEGRKYQDVSNDPGVSFKSPTHVSPEASGAAVAAHEGEHVRREQASAQTKNQKVVAQYVQYSTGVCPECGKTYVAGGRTTTMTKGESKPSPQNEMGTNIDLYA